MASENIIAVVSDALRGQVQAALPEGAAAMLGVPRQADVFEGVWLHLFRIAQPPVMRTTPVIAASGKRLNRETQLHLDYLICGQAPDGLQAHALSGMALAALVDQPMLGDRELRPFLSQPHRHDALLPGSLSVQWKALDLPLLEQAAVWQASGTPQQAGVFWRADVNWRSGQ